MTGTPTVLQHVNPFAPVPIYLREYLIDPVERHGAAGNGIKDDSAALADAIEEAAIVGRKAAVLLRPGLTFRVASGTVLAGATGSQWTLLGGGGTTDRPTILVDGDFDAFTLGTAGNIVEGITIDGVTFYGTNGTGASQRALRLEYCKNATFRNCAFRNFTGIPFYASGGGPASTFNLSVENCWFLFNDAGSVKLEKGATAGNHFRRCAFLASSLGAGEYSLDLIGFIGGSIEESIFEDAVTPGTNAAIRISACNPMVIKKNWSESLSFLHASSISNLNDALTVEGNMIGLNATGAIGVFGQGCRASQLKGNTFLMLSGGTGTAWQLTGTSESCVFEGNFYGTGVTAYNNSGTGGHDYRDGSVAPRAVTANYTLTFFDRVVLVDDSAGNVTISVPAAALCKGHRWTVKKIAGGNTTTIDPSGAETIDGLASLAVGSNIGYTFTSNGTNLFSLANNN